MKIELVRNATLRVTYAGRLFVMDPYLAPKRSLPSFTGRSPNPMVDLPYAPEQVIDGVEMALVSHLHSDHFDTVAQQLLPSDTTLFCQPVDADSIREMGFDNVTPVLSSIVWHDVTITRTPGRHGASEAVLADMGTVSGFLFEADGEPTLYWAGDTVWYEAVADVIENHRPDVIVTHSCGAVWGDNELIVMDAAQTVDVCHAAPDAVVVATHMEALDHATVSRQMLVDFAHSVDLPEGRLVVPDDGDVLVFQAQRIGRG